MKTTMTKTRTAATVLSSSDPSSTDLFGMPVGSGMPGGAAMPVGLACYVAVEQSAHTAPVWSAQGTGVSAAGGSASFVHRSNDPATSAASGESPDAGASALVAIATGARVTDLPGSPPRGAPV